LPLDTAQSVVDMKLLNKSRNTSNCIDSRKNVAGKCILLSRMFVIQSEIHLHNPCIFLMKETQIIIFKWNNNHKREWLVSIPTSTYYLYWWDCKEFAWWLSESLPHYCTQGKIDLLPSWDLFIDMNIFVRGKLINQVLLWKKITYKGVRLSWVGFYDCNE